MVVENVCRWFWANFAAKRCGMIQDTTFRQIKAWHMSWQGLEGLPEQGTDITEAIPHTINKWAQDTARQDKAEVGWPHWVAGRPPDRWRLSGPHGLNPATWRLTIGSQGRFTQA
jgi:hypothetical protein